MLEYAQSRMDEDVPFSEDSVRELRDMLDKTITLCRLALDVFHTRDKRLLPQVLVQEEMVIQR